MTECAPTCPSCGNATFRKGCHCVACLEDTMRTMTSEDWAREISKICDNLLLTDRNPT